MVSYTGFSVYDTGFRQILSTMAGKTGVVPLRRTDLKVYDTSHLKQADRRSITCTAHCAAFRN